MPLNDFYVQLILLVHIVLDFCGILPFFFVEASMESFIVPAHRSFKVENGVLILSA